MGYGRMHDDSKPVLARALFEERRFAGFFTLHECGYMVGTVAAITSFSSAMICLLDLYMAYRHRTPSARTRHLAAQLVFHLCSVLVYGLGAMGSRDYDAHLLRAMGVFMAGHLALMGADAVPFVPHAGHDLLARGINAAMLLAGTYALVKVCQQRLLLSLWDRQPLTDAPLKQAAPRDRPAPPAYNKYVPPYHHQQFSV